MLTAWAMYQNLNASTKFHTRIDYPSMGNARVVYVCLRSFSAKRKRFDVLCKLAFA